MTTTPARETGHIRWNDSRNSADEPAFTGHVGDLFALFKIWPPEDPGDEWLLTSGLPGSEGRRCYGFPIDLKREAERWLEEFAASIGAVFPGDAEAAPVTRDTCSSHPAWPCPEVADITSALISTQSPVETVETPPAGQEAPDGR